MYYIIPSLNKYMGFPGGLDVKEAACKAGDLDSISASGRSPGMRREWQTIPVILAWRISWSEESGRLFGPWGHKKLDTTEQLTHIIKTP